jgi:ribosomal protein S27E
MMLRIACRQCGHIGIVSAERLPAELRCWQCGSSRRVEVKDGARVRSREAVMEWILGAKDAAA